MTIRAIQRALLSVYDKTGLVELGRGLRARGIELLSTGGTAAALRTAELEVVDVSAVTGAPEILDGRVKTLHPAIHGGILARRDLASHLATIAEHSIVPIDLVVANLYPFEATLGSGMGFADCVERIDVGGPAMIRAAAKNHNGVAVLVEPADYDALLTELDTLGGTGLALRRRLAAKAFARTAAYDAAIAGWLAAEAGDALPERLVIAGMRRQSLRYGENPHQRAAFYAVDGKPVGVAAAVQLQGKELSFNNLNDTDAALALVSEFDEPAVVIVKHANACGVGMGEDPLAAYRKALACDPVSAFGGIVACNRALDGATAAEICRTFTEVVVAAGVDAAAAAVFAERPNLRLLRVDELPDPLASGRDLRWLAGGFLVQDRDAMRLPPDQWQIATRRPPDEAELSDLLFAWKVVKHVKSNAIVLARDRATVGIGMGQTSRVDAVDLAARRAARHAGSRPCVLASDAFFPFADGLEIAVAAGATAVIQPGGSVRDRETIAAADRAGIAMVLTGIRHFRH